MDKRVHIKRLHARMKYYGQHLSNGDERSPYFLHKRINVIPNLKIAIERVNRGVHCICIDCEKPIPEERLEVVPGAIRCLVCQEIHESKK
jgi:RNA polymerase-binding transcription factor DksA